MSEAASKLGIEFEDELAEGETESSKNLLNEHENVEIEFSVIEGGAESEANSKAEEKTETEIIIRDEPAAKIDEREHNSKIIEFTQTEENQSVEIKRNNYRFGQELEKMSEINSLLKSEVEASIKIKVLEGSTELLLAKAQEAKVLELQVNEIIGKIHKKVPGLKPELLKLRKILTEYSEKAKKIS